MPALDWPEVELGRLAGLAVGVQPAEELVEELVERQTPVRHLGEGQLP